MVREVLKNGARSEWARMIVAGLLSSLVTFVATWMFMLREVPTRGEVRHMVATESPYLQDRRALQNSIQHYTTAIGELTNRVRELEKQVSRIEAMLRFLLAETGDKRNRNGD